MTDTTIEIPDYVTMVTPAEKRSVVALARDVHDLLLKNNDLPAPRYFTVSQAGQEVSLQLGDSPDTFNAMAQWADRFGSTVTGEPHTRDDGRQSVYCEVKFTDFGVTVKLYAFITAGPASTT
jgi:hypothetical protein